MKTSIKKKNQSSSKKQPKKTNRPIIKTAAIKGKRIRRVLQVEKLDKLLLNMAQKPYNKILAQIELGKQRLNEERRLALELGTRILTKAKKVRDSLINSSKVRS